MLRYLLIILAILYFLMPYDLLPDFIPSFGRIDDIILMAYIYWAFFRKQKGAPRPGPDARSGTEGKSYGDASRAKSTPGSRPRGKRDPYEILGTNRQASLDEIKHAYRIQANRYHPDKVAHLGEEFQTLAKERFQDIQWAYEEVMRGRA